MTVFNFSSSTDFTETASKNTLEQVMAETLCKSGSTWSAVRAVCLGVSGVNHPRDQERILKWLRYIVLNIILAFFYSVKLYFNSLLYVTYPKEKKNYAMCSKLRFDA